MRPLPVRCPRLLRCGGGVWIVALALLAMTLAPAQARDLYDPLAAVARVKAAIEPDGRTVGTLGREREGSGVLIDTDGLVLTTGYLMVEAHSAEIGLQDGRTIPASVVARPWKHPKTGVYWRGTAHKGRAAARDRQMADRSLRAEPRRPPHRPDHSAADGQGWCG